MVAAVSVGEIMLKDPHCGTVTMDGKKSNNRLRLYDNERTGNHLIIHVILVIFESSLKNYSAIICTEFNST